MQTKGEQMTFADMAKNLYGETTEEYNEFVEKFKPKHTTDDCFTPENIYDVVASWVENEYKIDKSNFVRPFYPGGDYENYTYPEGCAVVDNPPFSIIANIQRFYKENGIKYFLFCPGLTPFKNLSDVCAVCVNASITYENGACVGTSFVTNMEGSDTIARSAPDLYEAIVQENKINEKAHKKTIDKIEYPNSVVTAAMIAKYGKYGIHYSLRKRDALFIRAMDEQKAKGKGIFGCGYLLSERAAAERAAAERAAAERAAAERAAAERAAAERAAKSVFNLSEREKKLQKQLG